MKLNILYFAFTDDNLESQYHCSQSVNQEFFYQRSYNSIPQIMILLNGLTMPTVGSQPHYVLYSSNTQTSYQTNFVMQDVQISDYCFSVLIGDNRIIQQFYTISDFTLAPLSGVTHSNSSYLFNSQIVRNPVMIGMIGSNYLASFGYDAAVLANPPNYQVYTQATTQLLQYATSSAMYTPIQCELNPSTNLCLPICGDGLQQTSEQCDDGNTIAFDGCFNCQFQCIEHCASCQQGHCQQCQTGFDLAQFSCQPICGDGLIIGNEQCDDSSIFCYNCQLKCQLECEDCSYGNCLQCIQGYYVNQLHQCEPICGDSIVAPPELCDDGNQIPFDGCYQCQFSCPLNCDQCLQGMCTNCYQGYYLSTNQCQTLCGDGIVVGSEECDYGGNTLNCHNCMYQCDINCAQCNSGQCQLCLTGYMLQNNICVSICGDMITQPDEQCDDGNILPFDGCWNCRYDCPLNCQTCINGSCQTCKNGFYQTYQSLIINTSNSPAIYLECNSLCGDGITVGNEICDDNNNTFFDGCYNCQLSCQPQCSQCSNTQCLVCKKGYSLFQGNCYSICGDGYVVAEEYCDDGNSYPFDKCHQCGFACSQYCVSCYNGYCSQCQIGFQIKDNICISDCGDNIVAQNEECDNGNIDIYGGCYQCQHQCPYATSQVNGRCYNICGDGQFAQDFEQCDDGNIINGDGCSNCRIDRKYTCESNNNTISKCYPCPPYCANCSRGSCKVCQFGYFLSYNICVQCSQECLVCFDNPKQCLVYSANKLSSVCGDGIKSLDEDCDDGNLNAYDGCNAQCHLEPEWFCNYSSIPNQCVQIKLPSLILYSVLLVRGQYQIMIGLDQFCRIYNKNVSNLFLEFSDNNLNYTVTQLFNNSGNSYQNITFQIILNPKSNLLDLYLNASIQEGVFQTQQGIIVNQITKLIQLPQIQCISEMEQQMLNGVISFNNYIIYLIIAIVAISILIGSFEPVLNMFDLIQQFSYLQWINIYFPYLLESYLNIFKLFSLDYIIEYVGFNFIEYPYQQAAYKLDYYGVNVYLYANLQSFMVSFSYCYLIYFIIRIICKASISAPTIKSYLKLKWQLTLIQLYKSTTYMHFSGVVQIIMSSTYDITTTLLLYFCYQLLICQFDLLQICTAVLILCTIVLMVISSTIINTRKVLKCMKEGVNLKHILSINYQQYAILKKLLFCFIIVVFQQSGSIQTLLISMNSMIFSAYIIINKPLKSNSEFAKILIGEAIISIQTLSFIVYDLPILFDLLDYMQWINIILFSILLVLCLMIDLVNTSRRTYRGLSQWFPKDRVTSSRDLSEI